MIIVKELLGFLYQMWPIKKEKPVPKTFQEYLTDKIYAWFNEFSYLFYIIIVLMLIFIGLLYWFKKLDLTISIQKKRDTPVTDVNPSTTTASEQEPAVTASYLEVMVCESTSGESSPRKLREVPRSRHKILMDANSQTNPNFNEMIKNFKMVENPRKAKREATLKRAQSNLEEKVSELKALRNEIYDSYLRNVDELDNWKQSGIFMESSKMKRSVSCDKMNYSKY